MRRDGDAGFEPVAFTSICEARKSLARSVRTLPRNALNSSRPSSAFALELLDVPALERVQLHQDSHHAASDASDGGRWTNRLWDVADLVDLLIASESKKAA